MGKTRKSIKQELETLGQRMAKVNLFRSRSKSPSPSARNAASEAANDPDVRRATSVSSHRNSLAGAAVCESLPSHPLKSSGTSDTRPCSTSPSQTAVPLIVINGLAQAVDGEEITSLKENHGPQSPLNQQ